MHWKFHSLLPYQPYLVGILIPLKTLNFYEIIICGKLDR